MLKRGVILIRICVLFDNLNKCGYSKVGEILRTKSMKCINTIRMKTVRTNVSPATFYIKSDIKRFINDISILNLHK